jgi:hypothetical protein
MESPKAQRAAAVIPLVPFVLHIVYNSTKVNVFKKSQTGGSLTLLRQPLLPLYRSTGIPGTSLRPPRSLAVDLKPSALLICLRLFGDSRCDELQLSIPQRLAPRWLVLALPQIGTDTNIVGSLGADGGRDCDHCDLFQTIETY